MAVRAGLWIVAAGVVVGAALAPVVPAGGPAAALAAAGFTAAALPAWPGRRACAAAALALGALALGAARGAGVARPRLATDDVARLALPARAVLVGRIVAPPARRAGRMTLVVAAESLGEGPAARRATGRVRVSVRGPVRRWRQGDRLAVTTTLRRPRNFANPGGLDWVGHLTRRGIHVTAGVWRDRDIRRLPGVAPTLSDRIAHARDDVARAIRAALPTRPGAVLRALVVGDAGGVDPALRAAFARAGVVHVLCVSGLHVALVGAAGFVAARWLLLRSETLALAWPIERVAAVLALGPVAAYAALAGLAVPTVRATLMAVATTLAVLLGRRPDVARTLALAAIVVTLAVPGAPLDAGFQLSFASVAAILVGVSRFAPARPDAGWRGRLRTTAVVAAAALAGTAPLTAFHFHQLSVVGVVANPLVIPIFGSAAVVPGLAGAALLPVAPPAAQLLFRAAGLVLARGIALVTWLARPAWAAVDVPTPDPLEVALCYALLAAVVLRAGVARRVLLAAALTALAADAAWCLAARYAGDRLRVTFLDVGQGDAAVVELPGGPVLVVDAGGFPASDFDTGVAVVDPFLHARKIRVADVVAMTHAHPDHAGGLAALLRPGVRAFWWNGQPGAGRQWARLLGTLGATGTRVERLAAGDAAAPLADAVEVLHPPRGDPGWSLNDGSLTLAVRHHDVRVLLTGDIEARAEEALLARAAPLAAQVVKVPHHGSRTSSTAAFVAAVRPQVAVISVGADNRYGQPAAEVEARWRAVGACVLRTDACGAVTVTSDGARVHVATHRPGCGCPGLDVP
jgi:competence protein ComEC